MTVLGAIGLNDGPQQLFLWRMIRKYPRTVMKTPHQELWEAVPIRNGWADGSFTALPTMIQLYQDDGRVNMKDSGQ